MGVMLTPARVPMWNCASIFGEPCSPHGLDVLSNTDIAIVRGAGLRIYVYRNVPPEFHRDLFARSKPREVQSGRVCDFMRLPM